MSSSRSHGARILRGEAGRRAATATLAEIPAHPEVSGLSLAERVEMARAQGLEEGRLQAAAEHATDVETERVEKLRQLAVSLTAAASTLSVQREAAVRVAEHDVVLLALELAETILQRELQMSRSLPIEALQRALSLVPGGEDLVVRMHPDDADNIEGLDDELRGLVPPDTVRIVPDVTVERGGCVLEAGACRVDAQIGPAIERARALIGAVGAETTGGRGR